MFNCQALRESESKVQDERTTKCSNNKVIIPEYKQENISWATATQTQPLELYGKAVRGQVRPTIILEH